MPVIHRLTVEGRDYFLPDPVDSLKGEILAAVRSGGDYVTIPPLRGGPGLEILFSPGMPVTWAQIDVGHDPTGPVAAQPTPAADEETYQEL